MSALDRARDWFIEPAPARPVPARPAPAELATRSSTCAAVLGRRADAEPIAAALALILRHRDRAPAAVVAVAALAPADAGAAPHPGAAAHPGAARSTPAPVATTAGPSASAPVATTAARRLAARLDAHGLEATARGRLAWVRLPAETAQMAAAAQRAVAMGEPTVLALAVPRGPALDAVLADQDLIVLVAPDGPLIGIAKESLAALGPPVTHVAPLPSGPSRALALAGLHPGRVARVLAVAELATGPAAEEAAW